MQTKLSETSETLLGCNASGHSWLEISRPSLGVGGGIFGNSRCQVAHIAPLLPASLYFRDNDDHFWSEQASLWNSQIFEWCDVMLSRQKDVFFFVFDFWFKTHSDEILIAYFSYEPSRERGKDSLLVCSFDESCHGWHFTRDHVVHIHKSFAVTRWFFVMCHLQKYNFHFQFCWCLWCLSFLFFMRFQTITWLNISTEGEYALNDKENFRRLNFSGESCLLATFRIKWYISSSWSALKHSGEFTFSNTLQV